MGNKEFLKKTKAKRVQQYENHSKRNTERATLKLKKKREIEKSVKEELGWMKWQMDSNHLNKPAYRSKYEDVKKKDIKIIQCVEGK